MKLFLTLKTFVKKLLPKKILNKIRSRRKANQKKKILSLQKLNENEFRDILKNHLGVVEGATVFVHCGMQNLHVDFSAGRLLQLLMDLVGPEGNLLFPTHINARAEEHLKTNPIFNIKKTPSYMGMLSEAARRHPLSKRSMHPTNSIVALGKNSSELVESHHLSIWPCGDASPYFKFSQLEKALIIGIGVSTEKLSFVHAVEDVMQKEFPVPTRDETVYSGICLDKDGNSVTVDTLVAHERIQRRAVEKYIQKHIDPATCQDLCLQGHTFFRADAKKLFHEMRDLALKGTTIYY